MDNYSRIKSFWYNHFQRSTIKLNEMYNLHTYEQEERLFNYPLFKQIHGNNFPFKNRESCRSFTNKSIDYKVLEKILSSALWKNTEFDRAYPNAGALYEIEVILMINNVTNYPNGIYHVSQTDGKIGLLQFGTFTNELLQISQFQSFISQSNFFVIFMADFDKTISKYDERGYRYTYINVGHISENFYIAASAHHIGCVSIGGFADYYLKDLIQFDERYEPIYMMAFGTKND